MSGENATALTTVSMLLEQRALVDPDRLAMIVAGGGDRVTFRITFAEWKRRSDAVAAGVAARGIVRGDRVGLLFDGTEWIDFAVAFCGVLRAGAVAVPLSAGRPSAALAAMIGFCDAAAVIHGDVVAAPDSAAVRIPFGEVMGDGGEFGGSESAAGGGVGIGGLDAVAAPQPGDPAQILFTSGTTAFPKGVVASHANLTYGSGAGRRLRPLSHSERFVHAFPIGTNAATMMLTTTLVAQPTAVIQPVFDAEGFCALIESHRAGTVYLIPPAAAEILNSGAAERHDLSCVQLVNSAAAALPPAVARRLAAAFPGAVLVNSYTSTEAAPAQTAMIVDLSRPGSVGRPVGAGDIRILAEDGKLAAVGEVGDVHLRSAAPQRSYFRDPAGTAEVFGSGWTKMGDVGYLDADGYLFLTDRDSDVIKTGGHRVSTLHVEAVLLEHPAVAQVAVLGLPHATMGTMVGAAVVLRGITEATDGAGAAEVQELREFARGRLARHEVPGQVLIVGELPRNPTGKVVKRMLLPLFGAESATRKPGDEEAVETDDVSRRIAQVWSRVFGGTVAAGADFFAAGGDSLRASQLAVLVREEFGVDVPGSFAFDLPGQVVQAAWLRTA